MLKKTKIYNMATGGYDEKLIHVEAEKVSKNAKRKAKRYGTKIKVKTEKRKAVTGWQYATQMTHRARFGCNPETLLINKGY